MDDFLLLLDDPAVIDAIFLWNAGQQDWDPWARGLPGPLQTLVAIDQNASLLLFLSASTTYRADFQSYAEGDAAIVSGFAAIAYLDQRSVAPAEALAALPNSNAIRAIFRFNNQTREWDVFNPLLPLPLNTIQILEQFDALLVASTGVGSWPHPPFTPPDGGFALRIGLPVNLSGGLQQLGDSIELAVSLAVTHVNAAGGVNGAPVTIISADVAQPQGVAEVVRTLIETDGVHAIVGPLVSGDVAVAFGEVAGPAGILLITPSGTVPDLTQLDDDDLFFRSTPNETTQGLILARLATAAGVADVALLVDEEGFAPSIADVFEQAFAGEVTRVLYTPGLGSYADEAAAAAASGSTTLVAIGFPPDAAVFLPEVTALGQFERFFFNQDLRNDDLFSSLNDPALEGAQGATAFAGGLAQIQFDDAFFALFGEEAALFAANAYDAVIALAFAAEAANSTDSAAIRDQLRLVAGPPGIAVLPGAAGIAEGLARIRAGEAVDYQGAATDLDWDEAGEVLPRTLDVWEVQAGAIVSVEPLPFELP